MAVKTLIIYTSTSDRKKKLKSPVQILLTLTPASPIGKPVVWKVLTFHPNGNAQLLVKAHTEFGFSTFTTTTLDERDVLQVDQKTRVEPGNTAVFSRASEEAPLEWTEKDTTANNSQEITAKNSSKAPQNLVLCCVDTEDDVYEPLVQLPQLMDRRSVKTGLPVMLQAYPAAGCKVGQLLQDNTSKYPLLYSDDKKNPAAIDILDLHKNTAFHLYSNDSGKIILEKQVDDGDDDDDDDDDE